MRIYKGQLGNNKKAFKAAKIWFEEMKEKKWMANPTFRGYHDYFVIYNNGEVVSILLYEIWYFRNHAEITGAWTHPEYRRKHLYSMLFEKLVEKCKEDGVGEIMSGCHKENEISITMQRNQGREIMESFRPDYYRTRFVIPSREVSL